MYLNFRDKNQYRKFFSIFGAKIQIPNRQNVPQIIFSMEIPHIFNVVILVNFWWEVLCVKQIKYHFWRENSKSFIYFM